jgi:hypothetical protein
MLPAFAAPTGVAPPLGVLEGTGAAGVLVTTRLQKVYDLLDTINQISLHTWYACSCRQLVKELRTW